MCVIKNTAGYKWNKVAGILLHHAKNQGEWQIGHQRDKTKTCVYFITCSVYTAHRALTVAPGISRICKE